MTIASPISFKKDRLCCPKFGWNQSVDIGTSQDINAKVAVFSDDWTPLGEISQPHTLVSQTLAGADMQTRKRSALMQLIQSLFKALDLQKETLGSAKEAIGKQVIFFVPGQVHGTIASSIGLRYPNILVNTDFKSLPAQLSQKLEAEQIQPSLRLDKNAQLILLNDMAGGAAASMAQLAKKHPDKFKPGLEATYLMSGGTLGVAGMTYEADGHSSPKIRLQLMEHACLPTLKMEADGRYSKILNPTLSGFLEAFTKALPPRYHSQQSELIKSLNGRLVTDYKVAHQALPDLNEAEFNQAAKMAIREYMDVLGGNLRARIANGSNLAILGGQTASGVRNFVNKHPDLFQQELNHYSKLSKNGDRTAFDSVFLWRVFKQLSGLLQALFIQRNFDVVSDLTIKSNIEGAPYIAKGWFQNRSDRYVIPASVFMHK